MNCYQLDLRPTVARRDAHELFDRVNVLQVSLSQFATNAHLVQREKDTGLDLSQLEEICSNVDRLWAVLDRIFELKIASPIAARTISRA